MPQSERSQIMKELLSWLDAKSKGKGKGATLKEIIHHTQLEITDLGASNRTIRGYIRDLLRTQLIHTDGLRFMVTEEGKNWLERKFLG